MSDVIRPAQTVKQKPAAPPKSSARPAAKPASLQAIAPAVPRRTSRSLVLKREFVKRSKPAIRRRRTSLKGTVLPVLVGVLFLFGLGVGLSGLRTNHRVAAQIQSLSKAVASGSTDSSDVPAETKPASPTGYTVAPTVPRILTIPKIGVSARVMRTTVNSKNQLGTPNNIFDTAWYDGSARPGEQGAVLIDGHVSGPTQNGVFYNLKKLQTGDKIQLQRGDGKTFTYVVSTIKIYSAADVDMAAALTPITPGKPGLNLITCTGKLDSSGTHFQQRLVVFATQQ